MNPTPKPLTHARLLEVLSYDRETGIFRWKVRLSPRGKVGTRAGSTIGKYGYRVIWIDEVSYQVGRLAWFYEHGRWPKADIDHIDGNRDNDRISNLREATRSQNLWVQGCFSHQVGPLARGNKQRRPALLPRQLQNAGRGPLRLLRGGREAARRICTDCIEAMSPRMDKSMKLGVFFSYFGGKFMRAPHYPVPTHDTIIEPFAGAAGYSTRYYDRNVKLIDASPYVAGVWRFLIAATENDIMALPLMEPGQDVNDLAICQEARWLLGFWINQGSAMPKRTMGGRQSNRKFGTWGELPRARLAHQVGLIKHWTITEGDYSAAPDVDATWFIDPPYFDQGKQYPYRVTNFDHLAAWCRSRRGQTMVCESEGAMWLPFTPVTTVAGSSHRITTELLWTNRKAA